MFNTFATRLADPRQTSRSKLKAISTKSNDRAEYDGVFLKLNKETTQTNYQESLRQASSSDSSNQLNTPTPAAAMLQQKSTGV